MQAHRSQAGTMKRSFPYLLILLVLILHAVPVARAIPPTIAYQPRDQAVILYQQAAFGVIASGTPPLAYQWRKDGVPIAGATEDQIVIEQAEFTDEGLYSVTVFNSEGTVVSPSARLSVNPPRAGDLDYSFFQGHSIRTVYTI